MLIIGYKDQENENPILKRSEFEVKAKNENEAIDIAKNLDTSKYSVWESYCETI